MADRLLALIVKELLALWRDRKSRVILVVPPLIQMLVFSFAATEKAKNVRIGVLNRDCGTASRDLIARFEGAPTFTRIDHLNSDAEMAEAIDTRQTLMGRGRSDGPRRVMAGNLPAGAFVFGGRRGAYFCRISLPLRVNRRR